MKKFLFNLPFLLIAAFIIYMANYHAFLYFSQSSIYEAEKKLLSSGVTVLEAGLNSHTSGLEILTDDWSYWDDSYNFVKDLNQKFIDSNMNDETLRNAGVNMVVFLNEQGSVVYKKTVTLEENQMVEIPPDIFKNSSQKSAYTDIQKVISSKVGVSKSMLTAHGLLQYSVYPLLKSSGEGPVRGALFMGRYYNSTDEAELKDSTKLNFETHPFINAPEKIQKDLLAKGEFDEYDANKMTRYKLVRDSFGEPTLYIVFNYERVVNQSYNKLIPKFAMFASLMGFLTLASLGLFRKMYRHFV